MAETATLELPTFKGRAGLGVHRAGRLHARGVVARPGERDRVRRLAPARAAGRLGRARAGRRRQLGGADAGDGVVVLPLSGRPRAPSRARRAAPRHDRPRRRRVHGAQRGRLGGRRVRPRAPRRPGRRADPAHRGHDAAAARSSPPRADRARGGREAEVWEQYLSGGDEATVLNTVVELRVGQNANLRYVCAQELNERSWIFGAQRAEVERDGALDWVALGFGSARGKVRMETLLAGPGADAKVTGAYAPHARQHVDFDTTQEHGAPNTTSGPRVPRHPRRPLQRRLARDDQGRPGRPADRRVPGVPQPAAVQEGARGRDPRPRDPRQRRPLHPRRGHRADRQGAALLPALARAGPGHRRRGS